MSQPSGSRVKRVLIADLQVDYSYQRPLSPGRVESVAAKWDDRKGGIITVSERADGSQFVIDGQHRMRACERNGGRAIKAEVWTGLSVEDEAEMFDALNDDRARVDPLSRFRAQLRYKHGTALAVQQTVEEAGATIQPHVSTSRYEGIRAVSTLIRIYNRSGREGLIWVLRTVIDAYGAADYTTATQRLLGGLEIVYANDATVNPNFSDDRLITRLREEGLIALNRLAATNSQIFGGYGARNVYRAICEVYNKGMSAKSGNMIGGDVKIRKLEAVA